MAKQSIKSAFRAIDKDDAGALERALASGLDPRTMERGDLLLVKAAGSGPEVTEVLIRAGADVNQPDGEGETPLLAATANEFTAVVALLLRHGADPNLAKEGIDTPLRRAAWRRSNQALEIAQMLIDAGADVNHVSRSQRGESVATPLTHAAAAANPRVLALLLLRGARVNEHVKFGTALTAAARSGDAVTVRLLLDAGADPVLRVSSDPSMGEIAGKTALEIAQMKRKTTIVDLLQS